jgi:hypothetical protein
MTHGVFRVKNHDFTPKNHDFTPKNHIFSNCRGRRENFGVFHVKNHDFTPKKIFFSKFRGCAPPPPPLNPPLGRSALKIRISSHLLVMEIKGNNKITELRTIKVITKLPNSEQSYKGKVKTHNYINRQNQSTTGKL